MVSMLTKRLSASLVLLYLGAVAIGLGVAYGGGLFANKTPSQSSPFTVTIVETMNPWPQNTSLPQPSFYLLAGNGLQHLTTLTLPVNRMIQLTIVSYDNYTTGSSDQDGKVTGTVGGNVYLMNGTIATMGNMAWGRNITSVPGSALAHNFNVPQLGINIPVVGGSTVVAYLYLTKAGPYTWFCNTPCGFPWSPSNGAMATSGWMEGQLIVQ